VRRPGASHRRNLAGVTTPPPEHVFDETAARRFEPRGDHEKTAVLVDIADDDALTVIRAPFGEQTMRGPFYAVADGEGSYGASRKEFERNHERTSSTTWRKSTPVLAYRAEEACCVHTHVGDVHETTVIARPGDWIVRQDSGEVMVVTPDAFEDRYRPAT
jgi:hypothetical protein